MTYNIDMYATEMLVKRLSSMQRRAAMFNHSREDVLDQISYLIEDLELEANLTEQLMEHDAD